MMDNQRESGFTLIELMAVLLISSVLLMAMYQNFVISQRSYSLLEGYSRLQENARFSEDVMTRTIRMAGYRSNPGLPFGIAYPGSATVRTGIVINFPQSGQVVSGRDNDAVDPAILNGTDAISVHFDGGNQMTDCFGNNVIDTYSAFNSFYVADNGANTSSLNCSSEILKPDGTSTTTTQPLIEGVEDMQILYGVDIDSDLIADMYRNAANVTATQWPNVVAVRIAALYTTVNKVPDTVTQSFPMLDNGTRTITDGLRRQLFTATINLRNKSL